MLLFAGFAEHSLAQTPGYPHGGGSCASAADCSLGGECLSAKCACDAWWTGPHCKLANLQPPASRQQGTCGDNFNSYFSWGGRALPDAKGTWHLYASFMCGHKSLSSWTTDSSSAHFTAANATGPFEWAEEECEGSICEPSLPPWSHNTVALAETSSRGGKGLPPAAEAHQIWHVGDAILNASVWSPCFNASEVPAHHTPPPLAEEAKAAAAGPYTGTPINPENGAYVSYAATPSGPWSRFVDAQNNTYIPIEYEGSWTTTLAGNPAPMRDPTTGRSSPPSSLSPSRSLSAHTTCLPPFVTPRLQ